jgi:hypothetical protein
MSNLSPVATLFHAIFYYIKRRRISNKCTNVTLEDTQIYYGTQMWVLGPWLGLIILLVPSMMKLAGRLRNLTFWVNSNSSIDSRFGLRSPY